MEIKAITREKSGTGVSNQNRREEKIPAAIYGKDEGSISVLLDEKEIINVLKTLGDSAVFNVSIDGEKTVQVYIKEVQRQALKRNILHVSMQTLKAGQKLTVRVPVVLENTENIKIGVLEQALYEVTVETLADKVPDNFTLDAGSLEIGDTLTVADLEKLSDVEVSDETDTLIATVSAPRSEEEVTVEAVEPEVIGETKEEK